MNSASLLECGGKTGSFNYLDQSIRHSLYRNGEVLTRRDRDDSDVGVILEKREMMVHNARLLDPGKRRTVTVNGFEMITRPFAEPGLDFFRHKPVVQTYYRDCAQIVQETTGARHVFAFDHNIRSATGKQNKRQIAGGQQVQGPAHLVHGDYTLTSAPQRLRDLANPPSVNDTLHSILGEGQTLLKPEMVERALDHPGRFAIINVWRNIAQEPVATHPLALCDAQSVFPQDLIVFEIHYQDRIGENYFAKHSPHHQWYYYPALTRDEVLLIKQWDSAGEMARSEGTRADADSDQTCCTFSFHSAIADHCFKRLTVITRLSSCLLAVRAVVESSNIRV